ncbi:MAG: hypothetical protein IJ158_03110 [Treponema sp.]|nr:hypothetical protein [Treponema sp.]
MGENNTRVAVYNEDYVSLNHAYVQIYKSYNKLLDCQDADEEVLSVMREILLVFNPTLDRIKSEMTVKTRYKEENSNSSVSSAKAVNDCSASAQNTSSSIILHGNFTGE